jgi:CheY-like chemotaxis protein
MELALLNLCLNARDAMPNGGTIVITGENIDAAAGEDAQTERVKISVADTGSGMPAEILPRVFDPFFTTKDVSKGSGLGLPQVYGFANQSGGRVTIDSAVGVGTIVTLRLPRSLQKPAPTSDVVDVAATGLTSKRDSERRGHVLLVEDDREVSALTRELLGALGFTVTHVASADAALGALANARNVEVVLSDVMMPGGVSGLQLAREIRRRYPGLPVLLTTGYVEAVADMKDGEFDLLPKPFTLEALADALGVKVR